MSGNDRFSNDDNYVRSSFVKSFFESGTPDVEDDGTAPPSLPLRPLISRGNPSAGDDAPRGATSSAALNMNDLSNLSASWDADVTNDGYARETTNKGLATRNNLCETLDDGYYHRHGDTAKSFHSLSESAFDEEEVLEQYRIMAQHDAMLRVKENTGFDREEFEKRRKMQSSDNNRNNSNNNKKSLYGGGKQQPQIRLPPLKKISPSNISLKLEEPPMPPPRVNNYFLQQAGLRVPELRPGAFLRGTVMGKDERLVRCLGCRNQFRVKSTATLMSCPECNTVSPTSSTR